MKHSIIGKIDKVAFPVFVVLFEIVLNIASSILWTHVILFIVQKVKYMLVIHIKTIIRS